MEITADHLMQIARRGGDHTDMVHELALWMTDLFPEYDIDTPQECAHFLAQACHETDRFNTLREYASGKAYEGRRDLGNNYPGDGERFRGRGIFQTTGRHNYLELGAKRGAPNVFVDNPFLLEEPEHAVWSACEFWKSRNLNDIANFPDDKVLVKKYRGKLINVSPVEYISLTINGGYNGMDERKAFYERAKEVLK